MSLSPWTWSPLRTLSRTLDRQRRYRGANGPARPPRRHFTEVLEQRLLLTAMHGATGDVFEYVDASGEIVRVRVTGNIDVELVGATVSGLTNTAEAANLPGVLNGTDIFGGLGGPGGIDIIGQVAGLTLDPDINALAADASGAMYALELQEIPV